jgi:hypothetical protein
MGASIVIVEIGSSFLYLCKIRLNYVYNRSQFAELRKMLGIRMSLILPIDIVVLLFPF